MVQTFWPVEHPLLAVELARVASDARSEPAPGSLSSWHHFSSLRTSGGRKRRRCSSVPCANSAGRGAVQPERVEPAEVERCEDGLRDPRLRGARGRGRRTPPARSRPRARCRRTSGTTPRTRRGSAPCRIAARPPARGGVPPRTGHVRVATHSSTTAADVVVGRRPVQAGKWARRTVMHRGRTVRERQRGGMADGRDHRRRRGRLRARVGIARPHTQPPHYRFPNEDTFRHVAEAYGDDNPLWSEPEYAADHPLGRADRVTAPGRGRHPDRRGRGHRARRRRRGAAPGRPDPRRARVLLRAAPGSGGRRCGPAGGWCAATRSSACTTSSSDFAERAIHEWTAEVFASRDPDEVLAAQYRLMIRTDRTKAEQRGEERRDRHRAVHRRADRRDRRGVGRGARAAGAAASRGSGRTSRRATRSARS